MGRERSPGFVRGLNSIGIPAQSFEGGMKKLSKLSVEETKVLLPDTALVTLIWSKSDGKDVKMASEEAMRVLVNAGFHYRIHGVMDFMCYFLGQKVNTENIFY
jgi:hypothetical protein